MRSCDQVASRKFSRFNIATDSQLSLSETAAIQHGQHILKFTVSRSKTSPTPDIDIQPPYPYHLQLN
jgi:hypothetical protein